MTRGTMILVVSLLLAGCSPLSGTDGLSGIEGQITIGPMCPVVLPDQPCPDKPFSAEVTVQDETGRVADQFRSDDQGRFHLALKPGEYTLIPKTYSIQHAPETRVTVTDGQFTTVTISYDSGIR